MQHGTIDILEKAKKWDRCYPGNINIEDVFDKLIEEVERLREKVADLEAELEILEHSGGYGV